jgi:hypothetical protein
MGFYRGFSEQNSPFTLANKVLQFKTNLTNSLEPDLVKYPLHKGVLYKLIGGEKQHTNAKDQGNPKSFYKDHLKPFKLQTSYLVTSFEQQLLMY